MNDLAARVAENLAAVRQRMRSAALRVGRDPAAVTLVAVTKYANATAARALVEAGCADLAESRPQELWRKAEALGDLPIRWHLVGHLQRNKARRTLPLIHLLHSADNVRLLRELDQLAGQAARDCQVLLEVNISGDEAKHGFTPAHLQSQLRQLGELAHVHVAGLMAMAALDRPGEAARADFRALRELRDSLLSQLPAAVTLQHLSMGMSGDFEQAIEEGATIVRVGSALFEGLADEG
jgi:pyridoxal phosphate enzyme (YggS family)